MIIALDCEADKALSIAYQLAGEATWVKVGMTLYYAYGTDLVRMLKARGYKVFLDLKFHDIPHQVEGAARSAAATGADMLTMHTVGGRDMMEAAQRGAVQGAAEAGSATPATLGITVLTSMSQENLHQVGIERPVESQVLAMAKLASESGISGVVASPREAASLRELLGSDAYVVTPGVRPAGSAMGDQTRVATPKDAFDAGASTSSSGAPSPTRPTRSRHSGESPTSWGNRHGEGQAVRRLRAFRRREGHRHFEDDGKGPVALEVRFRHHAEAQGGKSTARTTSSSTAPTSKGPRKAAASWNGPNTPGTSTAPRRRPSRRIWTPAETLILEDLKISGAMQVRKSAPEAVLVFVKPPSMDELERRLRGRGSESEEAVAARLEAACMELSREMEYDYVFVNDDVDTTVDEMLDCIANAGEQPQETSI